MTSETSTPNRVIFSYVAANRLDVFIGGNIKSIILLGAILCVPGLALMLVGFNILPVFGTDAPINGVFAFGMCGLVLFLLGSLVSCYRRWLTFDLSRRSLTIESGMLVPMFQRERNLSDFSLVSIHHESVRGAGDIYPVILTARETGNDYSVNRGATYAQAYIQAATLAKFLDLPIWDISSGHSLEIAPSDLAHPLQVRLQADTAIDPLRNAPAMKRIHLEESPTATLITVPHLSKITQENYFVVAIVILAVAMILITKPGSLEFKFIMTGIFALIGGIVILVYLIILWIARYSSTVVAIDNHALRIEERCGKLTRHTVVIPIADIIDIDYSVVNDRRRSKFSGGILGKLDGSQKITLKTKMGLYTFAAGLPDNEVKYCYSLIEKALRKVLSKM